MLAGTFNSLIFHSFLQENEPIVFEAEQIHSRPDEIVLDCEVLEEVSTFLEF
jgi:hypothetical protein